MHVAVTGGSGRIGQYILSELLAYGYDVTNVDAVPGAADTRFQRVDRPTSARSSPRSRASTP